MSRQQELKRARRMVTVFCAFTILYVLLSLVLIVTRGTFGLIYIAILTWSWFLHLWPDTKPHFSLLRNLRASRTETTSQGSAGKATAPTGGPAHL